MSVLKSRRNPTFRAGARSAPKPILADWSWARFWVVVALLFIGQAGLVLLLGERPHFSHAPAAPLQGMRLLDAPLDSEVWMKHVFAGDPAVFPSSSPHGFADQAWAWQRLGTKLATVALEEPSPAFLGFATQWAGARLAPTVPESRQTPFQLAGLPDSSMYGVPHFPAAEASRPESFFRIEGALDSRRLGPPVVLPFWTTNFLVTNSVVRFGVNRAGQVVSAVLLGGSGLKAADDSALATVNDLRFRPVGMNTPQFAWDTATFYWRTTPPK
jgi:TonB family protein